MDRYVGGQEREGVRNKSKTSWKQKDKRMNEMMGKTKWTIVRQDLHLSVQNSSVGVS